MDLNREICSIAYNCLNLPQRIDYQDGRHRVPTAETSTPGTYVIKTDKGSIKRAYK